MPQGLRVLSTWAIAARALTTGPPGNSLICLAGGSAGDEFACSAGALGSIPGLERSPGERNGYPVLYSGLENSMDRIYSPWGLKESRLSDFHFPGEKCVLEVVSTRLSGDKEVGSGSASDRGP